MSPGKRAAKPAIPKLARRKEAARRMVRALLQDLKQRGKPRRKGSRPFRPNPWQKCPKCYHRLPKMCPHCGLGRNLPEAPKHTAGCCPGRCPGTCGTCANSCSGPCRDCGNCGCRGDCKDKEKTP